MGSGGKSAPKEPEPIEEPLPVTAEAPQDRAIQRREESPSVTPSLLDDNDKQKANGNLIG